MEADSNMQSDDNVSEGGYQTALEDFRVDSPKQPLAMFPAVADEDVLVKVSTEGSSIVFH